MIKKDINLLPDGYKNREYRFGAGKIKLMILVLLFLGITALIWVPPYMVGGLQGKSFFIDSAIIGMEDEKNRSEMYFRLQQQIAQRKELIEAIGLTDFRLSQLLCEVWDRVPGGASVVKVEYNGRGYLDIEGEVPSYSGAAQFMAGLRHMTSVREVMPVCIEEKGKGMLGFEIICVLKGGSGEDEAE